MAADRPLLPPFPPRSVRFRRRQVATQPLLQLALTSVVPKSTSQSWPDREVGPTIPFADFAALMYRLSSKASAEVKLKLLFELFDHADSDAVDGRGWLLKEDLVKLLALCTAGQLPRARLEATVDNLTADCAADEVNGVVETRIYFPTFCSLVEGQGLVDRLTLDAV